MVVGLAGKDLVPAIDLLEHDHTGELVGERDAAERQPVVDPLELQPAERPSDHEAEVAAAGAPLLEENAELERVERLPVDIELRDESSLRDARGDARVLADLDQLEACVTAEQLGVMGDIIDKRWPQAADGDDSDSHRWDTRSHMDEPNQPERQINIHFSPEMMAGNYSNFANVSHSDYEFTITFARVDHEIEDEEVPGVVVTRVNLSPKFMRELIDAMQDNYGKWQTRENIKSLPEFGGDRPLGGDDPLDSGE
jgi:hypothetical protein